MKSYHILSHGDVRPQKATADEIQEFIDSPREQEGYRKLATVEMRDGEIIATALTVADLSDLAKTFQEHQGEALRNVLDATLKTARLARGIRGVRTSEALVIWQKDAPWAEDVLRDWAEKNGLPVHDDQLPATAERHWIRTMHVSEVGGRKYEGFVKIQWDSINVDGPSIVARDAELDGRPPEQVAAIRAEEMPF